MPTRYELQAARRLERLLISRERQIQAALADALGKMRADMGKIYERYAVDGVLSKAQMTQYNRLATMEAQILADLNPAIRSNLATIDKLRPQQYQASFFNYAWTVDQETQIALKWGVLNKNAVAEALESEFYHISKQRYGMNARFAVRSAVNDGLIQGKSYQRMARDLRGAINTTYNRALVIARTEGGFAQSAGQMAAYDTAAAQGVEGAITWIATLDGKTRGDHAAMDGMPRGDDGLFHLPGGDRGRFPHDEMLSAGNRINCRCDSAFEVTGLEPELRRTREDGIVPNQTYADWVLDRRTF